MSPEGYRPSFNKEAPLGRGGGGKREQSKQGRQEKQSATNPAQIERSRGGLSNETGDRRSTRRRHQFHRGPSEVATPQVLMLEGGYKKLRGNSSTPQEMKREVNKRIE
jgi:hypothetical protein